MELFHGAFLVLEGQRFLVMGGGHHGEAKLFVAGLGKPDVLPEPHVLREEVLLFRQPLGRRRPAKAQEACPLQNFLLELDVLSLQDNVLGTNMTVVLHK